MHGVVTAGRRASVALRRGHLTAVARGSNRRDTTPGVVIAGGAPTLAARLGRHAIALLPALIAVAVMLVWAEHDGGYDADTWYWGALLILGLLAAVAVGFGLGRRRLRRSVTAALTAFCLYVAWSYLSITWAQSPGDALEGSNRALMYLLLFTLLAVLPWTPEGALVALLTYVVGVGVIAMVILVSLGSPSQVGDLVVGGRLAAPTGYFSAGAALFTAATLGAIALAAAPELPALLRGALIATACAGLQLAVLGQSRGWLFTLPVVVIAGVAVVRDRVRVAAAAVIPIAATLASLSRLLEMFRSAPGPAVDHASASAGHGALLICAAAFVAGTVIARAETMHTPWNLSPARRRGLGAAVTVLALAGASVGVVAATHGHPLRFVGRQWRGFTGESTPSRTAGSHFSAVGSGRYDFWRVSVKAIHAHPIDGLGQDNFADYYIRSGRSGEEPRWTHSLELRLLVHTGIVGFTLFAAFVIAALIAARGRLRRRSALARAVSCAALLPFVVWFIHGSVDWFWEMPALTAPALGFLAIAGALGRSPSPVRVACPRGRAARGLFAAAGTIACVAAVVVLVLPYLSVRDVSLATDIRQRDAAAALRDLDRAASLNPLSAVPGRLAGAIALQTGQFGEAEQRFRQAIGREPGGWFSWLGDGLAASMLHDRARAHHDFEVAASINPRQTAVEQARAEVYSRHPLRPAQAFNLLVLEQ